LAERTPSRGDLYLRTRGSRAQRLGFVRPALTMGNVAGPSKVAPVPLQIFGPRLGRITPLGLLDIFAIGRNPSHAVGALFKEIMKFGIRDSSEDSLDCVPQLVTGRVGSIPEEPDAGDDDARRDDGSSSDDPRRAVLHHRPLVPPNFHLDLLDDPPMRAMTSLVASSSRAQTLPRGTSVKPAVIRSVRPLRRRPPSPPRGTCPAVPSEAHGTNGQAILFPARNLQGVSRPGESHDSGTL
jgi:hypothetical protein